MPDTNFRKLPGERVMILVSLLLGLLQAWVCRYAMNPDGMSYLDVGDSFFRRDWGNAVNAWWSPLYPWTLGLTLGIVKPSLRWEFPLVQFVNFGIFVFALLAFRFLLHATLTWKEGRQSDDGQPLPASVFAFLAYSIFLWIALEVITIYAVGPDLFVSAFYCLSMGILLRLSQKTRIANFAIFGLVLGLGYWAKAILFPLGVATLIVSYLWKRSHSGWKRGMLVATIVFLGVCSPLILLLSHQKGRFTFGDSGKYNYAWHVFPRAFSRNWQGDPPGSGKPVHSTRRLLESPPLYEFDGPVVGTYPPWTDPSYWNEGLQWHFKLNPQLEVLSGTVPSEARVLLRARPELVTAVALLVLLSGRLWLIQVVALWPPIILSVLGMALYLPLVENDRYLGGYALVLFLLLLGTVRLPSEFQKSGTYVVMVAFVVMMISTADYTLRIATNHLAIPGVGPNSTWHDVIAAEQLQQMGLHPGDKVAVIGDGTGAYWARLAKLRIVAEIMDANHGSSEFWSAADETKQHVYEIFSSTQAMIIVSRCPTCSSKTADWRPIAGTDYCVHRLD